MHSTVCSTGTVQYGYTRRRTCTVDVDVRRRIENSTFALLQLSASTLAIESLFVESRHLLSLELVERPTDHAHFQF